MKMSFKDRERRKKATQTLERFHTFLQLGKRGGPRCLSPARALEHLQNTNVTELLGERDVNRIQMAAELLA